MSNNTRKFKYLQSRTGISVRCEICYWTDKESKETVEEWFLDYTPVVFASRAHLEGDIKTYDKHGILSAKPKPRRGKQQRSGLSQRDKQVHALSSAVAMEELFLELKAKYPKVKGYRIWGNENKYKDTNISYSSMMKITKHAGIALGWQYHNKYVRVKNGYEDYKPGYWVSDRKSKSHPILTDWCNLKKSEPVIYKSGKTYSDTFPRELENYAPLWKSKIEQLNDVKAEYRWGVQKSVTYKTPSFSALSLSRPLFSPYVTDFCAPSSSAHVYWLKSYLTRYRATISEDGMTYLDSHARSMSDWSDTVVEIDDFVYECVNLDYNAQGVHVLAELCDVTLPHVQDVYAWIASSIKQPITRAEAKVATNTILQSENRKQAMKALQSKKNFGTMFLGCNIKLLVDELECVDELAAMLYSADLSRIVIDAQSKIEALTTLRLHEEGIPALSKRDCWRVPTEARDEAVSTIERAWHEYWEEMKQDGLSSYTPKLTIEQ